MKNTRTRSQQKHCSRPSLFTCCAHHVVPTPQKATTFAVLLYFSILKYYILRFNIWIKTDAERCRKLQRNYVWGGAASVFTLSKHERKH